MCPGGGTAAHDADDPPPPPPPTPGHLGSSSTSSSFVAAASLAVDFLSWRLLPENGESACIRAVSAPFCPAAAATTNSLQYWWRQAAWLPPHRSIHHRIRQVMSFDVHPV